MEVTKKRVQGDGRRFAPATDISKKEYCLDLDLVRLSVMHVPNRLNEGSGVWGAMITSLPELVAKQSLPRWFDSPEAAKRVVLKTYDQILTKEIDMVMEYEDRLDAEK